MNYKEIKSVFNYLHENEIYLNPGQTSFIGSLRKYFNKEKRLSERQIFILKEIMKYVQKQDIPVMKWK